MRFHQIVLSTLAIGFGVISSGHLCADDAQVLPKNRFRLRLATAYSTAENQFGTRGDVEGLGSSFSKRLDSQLLAAINPTTADTIRRLNAASPGLGDSLAADIQTGVKTEMFTNVLALEYGITDRLSVGFILPIIHAEVEVGATVTPDQALAQKAEALPDGDPRKGAIKQVLANLNTQHFQNTLTQGYNYQDGFQNWSGTGLGDLEVGAKYNYYRTSNLQSTLKGGVRLPSGNEDDPNKLFDVGFGDGQIDLGLYHITDFQFTRTFGGTLEVGYVYQLPDTASVRVPLSDAVPISPQTVELNRKLGDYFNAEAEVNYEFFRSLTLSARYRYYQKFKDNYSAAGGPNVEILERDSDEYLHSGAFQAEYTNLAAVRGGREKFPYAVALFYRHPFVGKHVADSRTTGIQLKTYF